MAFKKQPDLAAFKISYRYLFSYTEKQRANFFNLLSV